MLVCTAAACTSQRTDHDVYVWQQHWTPHVVDAVRTPPDGIRALRVLVAEVQADGTARSVKLDHDALVAARHPIIGVIRVNGSRLKHFSPAALAEEVDGLRVPIAGLEIDHDCATAGLGDYAAWLAAVRARIDVPLSITALPTWHSSPALPALRESVDEVVLQVHAVRAPHVFHREEAARYVRAFAARGHGALRVSVPTYRVDVGGASRAADPVEVAAFLDALPATVGVVFFRLPVVGDDTSWPRATLTAVATGASLLADVHTDLRPTADPALFDVVLENRGTLDAKAPAASLPVHVVKDITPVHVLRAGERRVVGWVRVKGPV